MLEPKRELRLCVGVKYDPHYLVKLFFVDQGGNINEKKVKISTSINKDILSMYLNFLASAVETDTLVESSEYETFKDINHVYKFTNLGDYEGHSEIASEDDKNFECEIPRVTWECKNYYDYLSGYEIYYVSSKGEMTLCDNVKM